MPRQAVTFGMVSHPVFGTTPSHRRSGWVCTTVAALADRDSGFKSGLPGDLGLGYNEALVTYCGTRGIPFAAWVRQSSLFVANVSTFLRPNPT
jgi:hypothetical protein